MKNGKQFALAFLGKKITVTMDLMSSITTNTIDGESITETYPVYFEGILLDFDEESLYLGEDQTKITQEIPRSRRINIKISDESEVIDAFLKQVPIDGEMN